MNMKSTGCDRKSEKSGTHDIIMLIHIRHVDQRWGGRRNGIYKIKRGAVLCSAAVACFSPCAVARDRTAAQQPTAQHTHAHIQSVCQLPPPHVTALGAAIHNAMKVSL
jgi:hypothetical protein